ncbi:hypothetical protein [Cytobacillus firmus]|nr:hypothetical protein [Cytobacillus firmus]
MKENNNKPFPGQKKGIIQILIKNTDIEESVQLRFDLDFDDQKSINS